MKTIKYYCDPDNRKKYVEVETDNEAVAEQLAYFKRREESERRKSRRRNEASIDALREETGWEPPDTSVNIALRFEEREEKKALLAAISRLSDKQQLLVRLYYYEEKTMLEIAQEFSVTKMAISQQLMTVHRLC